MAYVMALQQEWPTDQLKFQGFGTIVIICRIIFLREFTVNNDIDGLISSVNDGSTSAFMWEWFTTKPFADAGKVRFVSDRQCLTRA